MAVHFHEGLDYYVRLETKKFRTHFYFSSEVKMNPINNITISDAKTGFVLIERKYRWPVMANSANLGSLTQSFYQFAREVDDGFIESVVFEGKEPHGSGSGSGRAVNRQQQTMQMICTRNNHQAITVYFDTTTFVVDPDESSHLLQSIEKQFHRECGDLLSRVSGRILALVEAIQDREQEQEQRDIRAQFDFFAQNIDRIVTTAFPPPPSFLNMESGEVGGSSDSESRRRGHGHSQV